MWVERSPQIEAFLDDFREVCIRHNVPAGEIGAAYMAEAILLWAQLAANQGYVGSVLADIQTIANNTYRRRQL